MAQRDVTIRISAVDNFGSVMQKYNTEMKKAEDNTKQVGKQSSELGNTLKGLFTIALAKQVAGYVSEMLELGKEANASEARFRALTSTMGDYEATMQGLRRATLGVVDDMHLQQGAMLLIQTAGIESNDELERMMGLITRLKKPSEDMTDAINNFGLMLANNSILRLDSFGISASKVRSRILELQAELGVDRSQAFRMAVLEEGEKNLQKFGNAAEVAGTASSRFGVKMTNAAQDIAQAAAEGLEGWFLFFDYIDMKTAHIEQQQAQVGQALIANWHDIGAQLQSQFSGQVEGLDLFGMQGVSGNNFVASFTREAIALATTDPALMQDMDAFRKTLFERLGKGSQEQTNTLLAAGDSGLFSGMVNAIVPILEGNEALEKANDLEAQRLDTLETIAATQLKINHFGQDINSIYEEGWAWLRKQSDEQEFAAERQNVILSTYMNALGVAGQDAFSSAFANTGQAFGNTGVPQYLEQGQADAVAEAAAQARMLADNMAAAADAEEGLFTDEQVEQADAYASRLEDMAGSAQDAAEAFENMSLSEMFGQTDGGRLAEEMDAVTEAMKRRGAAEWEISNAQRAFDLRTGKENGVSLAFQDQIAPYVDQIMQTQGADAAVAFMTAFDETMAQAKLMGIDTNAPDFVAGITQQFTNPMNVVGFDPTSFLSGFQPAADNASAIQGSMTIMAEDGSLVSESFYSIAEKAPIISENMGLIETSLGGAVTHTDKIKTNLEDMSGQTYVVKIQPELVNIASLFMQLFPMVVQAVQQAGGVMPGTSQQASQSGTLVRSGGTPV